MDFKKRKKRQPREKEDAPITTITSQSKVSAKQGAPSCYRFNDYDKAEISLAVANAQINANTKVTPAKLLRALVRLNNTGAVNKEELSRMIDSL